MEQQLSGQIQSYKSTVSLLQSEVKTMKLKYAQQKSDDDKKLSDMKYENLSLQARVKQLQSSVNNTPTAEIQSENKDDSGIYEVEKLLDHQQKRDGLYFLVRWKNYTSDYDTWERESNLMCPDILKKYKQKKKI